MRRMFQVLALALAAGLTGGCGRPAAPPPAAAHFAQVLGGPGHTAGKFNRPRGVSYDPASKLLFVVDWDGRIQKFTLEGEFRGSWLMPEVTVGKPEDLCVTPEGTVLVTDTHYSRIIEFTAAGKEVRRFGSYGRGPGQFIYPVGICQDATGHLYVAEYGENDRVQKFTRTGEFVASFGAFGTAPGQFQRPSGIALGPDGNLYVTDAVNHRIQVLTTSGQLVRVIGSQGSGLGQFSYPYDVDFRNGQLYVLEYEGQRVQRLTLTGQGLAVWGTRGSGDGQFANPWRFCALPDRLFVSDTNNSRVVQFDF